MRRTVFLILIVLLTGNYGCAAQIAADTSTPIISLLQARQYADAIALVRRASATVAERDFAVGEIILQGWSDDAPVQRPAEPLDDGIALLEKSALANHPPATSGLSALYFTGLFQGETQLVKKNSALHACWRAVERHSQTAHTCVALRKQTQPDGSIGK